MASLLYRGQLRYYIEDKGEECIIDSIPHCHTENFLILPRLKAFSVLQCGILSMIDTPFFHYIATKPHFLLLPLFQSIFSMTVWNTIDDRYYNFFFYIETMHNLLIFARFQSIFSITVWNTIDDRYSIFPLYRNEATFLAFAPFSEHF